MTLVQSWIDSLALLKPKNAQLFIMVTIKSIIETYKVMFWYLLIVMGVPILFIFARIIMSLLGIDWMGQGYDALVRLIYHFSLFITCLATRPSIMKKDWAYFCGQNKKLIYWLLLPVLMLVFIYVLFHVVTVLYLVNTDVGNALGRYFLTPLFNLIGWILLPVIYCWSVFLILFFADSAGGPKNFLVSAWNSLKMIIYNYPLLAVIGICCAVLSALDTCCISPLLFMNDTVGVGIIMRDILGILLLPIGVCLYANIYIKKLHDQFDLYFMQS